MYILYTLHEVMKDTEVWNSYPLKPLFQTPDDPAPRVKYTPKYSDR